MAQQPNGLSSKVDSSIDLKPKPTKYARLSQAEKHQILAMRRTGLPYAKIAQAVGKSISSVYEYLQPFESTVDEAKAVLEAGASKAAKAWEVAIIAGAEQGNHKPAKDLLAAVGVVQEQANNLQLQVAVCMPGQAPDNSLEAQVTALGLGESADASQGMP